MRLVAASDKKHADAWDFPRLLPFRRMRRYQKQNRQERDKDLLIKGFLHPIAQYDFGFSIAESSDDFVGSSQDVGRNRKSDLLCRFQVDHQLKPRRLLDRKVGGLGTL